MRTLYLSDLDGTLLHPDATLSSYTVDTLNALIKRGVRFTFATARSYQTSAKVTRGLHIRVPMIVYGGAFLVNGADGAVLYANYFKNTAQLLDDLTKNEIFPLVYACIDGREKFTWLTDRVNSGVAAFLKTRPNDPRANPVSDPLELYRGDAFYIACIDTPEKLAPMYEKYAAQYHCIYQKELYTQFQWLEIMPRETTKAHAAVRLKAMLDCDKIVAFGDGKNDMDLFRLADECYAVENAVEELKQIATGVIAANDADGVAHWLEENIGI